MLLMLFEGEIDGLSYQPEDGLRREEVEEDVPPRLLEGVVHPVEHLPHGALPCDFPRVLWVVRRNRLEGSVLEIVHGWEIKFGMF